MRRLIPMGAGLGALALALGVVGAEAQDRCPGADSGPEAGVAALAAATECLIATERAAAGLPALAVDAALRKSAAAHAADMVERRYLSTTSPSGSDPEQRATAAGYGSGEVRVSVAEAFAYGSGTGATPRQSVRRWLDNPSLRRVVLDRFATDLGAGVARGAPRGPGAGAATYVVDVGRAIPLAAPEAGRTVGIGHVSGIVRVAVPGSKRYVRLRGKRIVRVGSRLDTRRGVVRVRSEGAAPGTQQRAIFYNGLFRVVQRRRARASQSGGTPPLTEMRLIGRLSCPPVRSSSSSASAAARRRPPRKRRLWGNGKGRFRTRGKFGTATVVGTRWLVEDTCAGTRVRVRSGVVRVRNNRTGRTRRLTAGRSVLIRRR